MIELIKYPNRANWSDLLSRPSDNNPSVESVVADIMQQVKEGGDQAVIGLTKKIDGVELPGLVAEISGYLDQVDEVLAKAIKTAKQNIKIFHSSQKEQQGRIQTMTGVTCWRESVPIENVGLYIPGGSAPLFSTLLMLAVPAKIAGSNEIVVCSPPQKDGKVHPVIGYTCELLGIEKIYLMGGAQAIAAMTYGTESVPRVDKIFGPGNQYVTRAKQVAQTEGVAIDMPAGPSEVLVIADDSSNAEFVAADLLSQAEHGPDSQVILVSTSDSKVEDVNRAMTRQLKELPREEIAREALTHSKTFLVEGIREAIDLSNEYAPEHLILSFDHAERWIDRITNAGSVFVGKYACESAGDYASGTNHTLPTNGYARAYSGVSLDSFVKKITFQKVEKAGISELGPHIEVMAEAEGLRAHKNAVSVRLKSLEK